MGVGARRMAVSPQRKGCYEILSDRIRIDEDREDG